MKTKNTLLRVFLLFVLFTIIGKTSSAQTMNVYIANDHLVSPTVYEFDVMLQSTDVAGANTIKLRTFQPVVLFNYLFINGTAPTVTPVSTDVPTMTLGGVSASNWTGTGLVGFQCATNSAGSCGQYGFVPLAPATIKYGTYRLTATTGVFGCAAANPTFRVAPDATFPTGTTACALTRWTSADCSATTQTTVLNTGIVYTKFYGAGAPTAMTAGVNNMRPTTTNPVATTNTCSPSVASFSVTGTGNGTGSALSYQWYDNSVVMTDGLAGTLSIQGSTSPTLTITNPTASMNGHTYNCVVSQCSLTRSSTAAALTVVPCGVTCNVTVETPSVTNVACFGASTGSINLCLTGAAAPVAWTINSNAAAGTGVCNTFSGLSQGTYTVAFTDANGCTGSATGIIVGQPASALSASGSASAILCNGGTSVVTVSATGGTGPYTGTGAQTAMAAGPYSYTVTDANGCTSVASGTITQPAALVASGSATPILCNGGTSVVTVSATGGNAPYTGTGAQTAISAGPYSYTVTDANGCTSVASGSVSQPSALVASSSAGTISCFGGTTTVNVSATGGTAPYSGTGSQTVSAGPYSFTVTDANGCTSVASGSVSQPLAALVASGSATAILCNGGTSVVTVSATGGTAPYIGTGAQVAIPAGPYSYTVTDANGCTSVASGTITQPAALVASGSATAILCNGGTSVVTVSATGGTAPYTGTGAQSAISAGPYSYTVTDANGCSSVASGTITQPAVLTATASATSSSCPTCADGAVTVTLVQGGTPTYSYTNLTGLLPGPYCITVTDANGCTAQACATVVGTECSIVASVVQNGPILCNGGTTTVTVSQTGGFGTTTGTGTFTVGAGFHSYPVSDVNGCTSTATITISQPSALVASSSAGTISCNGGTTTVNVSATGGTAPYTGTGAQTVGAGPYSFTVTDANGCASVTSGTITQPSALVASASATPILCNGGSSTITVSATGGTAPYTGTGAQTANAGPYSYTVTDANGCTSVASGTITQPAALVASASATPILCNGGTSTVTVSATGGTAPYTGTGAQTANAGPYSYTVTDANGCTSVASGNITQPTALVASSTAGTISCNGGTTTVNVSATGGTAPYTGTGAQTTGAGPYSYTVTDANGCTSVTTGNITQPAASVIASSSATPILCNGGTSTVTVSATGGTAPYTGTGAQTVSAGPYSFTVTDANGCSSVTIGTVTQPAALVASGSAGTISCNGGTTTVTVSATGGTAPYTGTGAQTVGAGPYSFTVTDANGCTSVATGTVSQPAILVASSSAGTIACNGGTTTVTVSATGGTAPYTGTGAQTVSAGPYSFTVTDAKGCTSIASGTVTQPAALVASASAPGSIACFGGTTSVGVSATGGTAPYTGTGSFSQAAGSHIYTVTDANGCSSTASVTLTQPAKVEGTTTTTPASGCSVADGSATVNPTGGTPGYTYLWSNGQTTQTATFLVAGTYTAFITDANGCSGSATATVNGSGGSVGTPGAISGPEGACRNTSGIVYSVAPVAGATSYVWTLPGGASGVSTTNSITLSFSGAFNGGFVCVAASNACGTGSTSCMNVPVITTMPGLPTVISGPSETCGAGVYTFSTSSNNAQSYVWTVTGTGAFIASGQGTNTITVSVPNGFTQGSVQVRGSNCNGTSAVRGMTITGIPAHSNAVIGGNQVCANGTAGYYMAVVPGVSSYVWSVTGDAIVASQSLNSVNSSCVINFGPTWTSGTVSITVFNTCGSYTRTFTVNSVPIQPGGITGPGTALCGMSNVSYSIAAVAGATSYTWTVPPGVSLVSTSPDGRTIVVNFTPAFTNTGNICVTANNSCGQGPARCYAVTARPGVPVVTGSTSVCRTQSSVPYTIAPVSGATSYTWSVVGGASITPSGNTANVNYSTSLSTSATIRANAVNACGASQPGGLTVAVNLLCRTADDVTVANTELGAYPNPTSGKATVSFNAASDSKYLIKVTDIIGNALISDVVNAIEGYNTQDIDLTGVAKGLYMISVTAADGTSETIRLVVQ